MKAKLLFVLLLFSTAAAPRGEAHDVYIAQEQAGSANGAGCDNARDVNWFNDPGHWGAGPSRIQPGVSPGDTIHLCGVISRGRAPFLKFFGSGTPGRPITLQFEPGAAIVLPTWTGTAIELNGQSYVTVDGGADGAIRTTANGTDGARNDAIGVGIGSAGSHIAVRNLNIGPLYRRNSLTDHTHASSGIYGGYRSGDSIEIANNVIHDAELCLSVGFLPGGVSNIQIHGNNVSRCATGIVFGSGGTGALASDVRIYANDISDGFVWDSDNDEFHCDGIHVWAVQPGTSIRGLRIYNNTVHGRWGVHTTSRYFIEKMGEGGGIDEPLVYNNLTANTDAGSASPTDGYIYLKGLTRPRVFNNTVIGRGRGVESAVNLLWTSGAELTNNIIEHVQAALYREDPRSSWASVDYNLYFHIYGESWDGNNFSQWRALGRDLHSEVANPRLDPAHHISDDSSPARRAGANLSSYFLADKDGVPHPTSGPWDVGAFQYRKAGEAAPRPVTAPAP